MQNSSQNASDLYEYALSEAISACMESSARHGYCARIFKGELEGFRGSKKLLKCSRDTTGIAAWDAAMLDEERRIAQESTPQEAKKTAEQVGAHPDLAMSQEADDSVENDARSRRRKNGFTTSTYIVGVHEASVKNDSCGDYVNIGNVGSDLAGSDDQPKSNNESWANVPKSVEAMDTPCQFQQVVNQHKEKENPSSSHRLERALDLATRCLAIDGTHANAYMLRAEIEEQLGRRGRAIMDFKAASLLSAGDPRPKINEVKNALYDYALPCTT